MADFLRCCPMCGYHKEAAEFRECHGTVTGFHFSTEAAAQEVVVPLCAYCAWQAAHGNAGAIQDTVRITNLRPVD